MRARRLPGRLAIAMVVALVYIPQPSLWGQANSPAHEALVKIWKDLNLGNWSAAENSVRELVASPEEAIACQAHFAEGNLWQFRRPGEDPVKAAAAYGWIVRRYPKNSLAAWALLALARIPDLEVLHPQPERAIPIYRRVMTEYPESGAAAEASLHLAEALFRERGKEGAVEAVRELARWREEHPSSQYSPQIELLMGKFYRYPLKDPRTAVTHLMAALDLGLATLPQRTATCWTIATLAEHELRDRDLAVRYYTQFLKEFPGHRTTFMAKQGLKRLGAPLPPMEDFSLKGVSRVP